jgi:hypothetical protein
MSYPDALRRFLTTDPVDPGCAKALEMLNAYVDTLLAGGDPEERIPDVAVHLRDCGPCAEDFEGLVAAVRRDWEGDR